MVLQRLGGGRTLVSPRLKILDNVLWSLRRLIGDLAPSARGDEAKPKISLHLDLGWGEDTKLRKKCTMALSAARRRLEAAGLGEVAA